MFDTNTGTVLQNYSPFGQDSSGSYSGITYSADGKYLVFSQDSSNVAIAKVNAQGLLEDDAQVSVPANNSFISCFPNSPIGDYGRACGTFYSPWTSYPGGVAVSKDGASAYALLNQNDTLTQIDLTPNPPSKSQIRVGNAPHSIVIAPTAPPLISAMKVAGSLRRRTSRSTPPALKSSLTRWWAPRLQAPFLWLICQR